MLCTSPPVGLTLHLPTFVRYSGLASQAAVYNRLLERRPDLVQASHGSGLGAVGWGGHMIASLLPRRLCYDARFVGARGL